jgi:hypothetical protein
MSTSQWKAAGTDITGSTASTYTLTQAEVGKAITVTVSYTDGRGVAESVTSDASAAVANVNDALTGALTITGIVNEGQFLTADTSALSDADGLGSFSYQWQAGGVDISNANSSTYALTQSEVGKAITVDVSYTDGQGTAESAISAATDAVGGPQAITIGHTDSSNTRTLFGDQSLVFVSSETDTTTVAMSSGVLAPLSKDLSFTHVELSNSSYDHGISISDVVLQLRDIVGLSALEGKQKIAADIDRNNEVTISDVVSNLRHIVGLDEIEQCALVDSSDKLVESLTSSTIADLTLVQYGDVDLSATFLIA